jgi:hypothetical protein
MDGQLLGKSTGGNKVGDVATALQRWIFWPLDWLQSKRGQLFIWVPIFLGCGVALWFALPFEPKLADYALISVLFLLGFGGPLARIIWFDRFAWLFAA